jgi:hypothetical protein
VVAVMLVDETTVTAVAAAPLMVTAVTPVKLAPVMVTEVPPSVEPEFGLISVTVGAEGAAEQDAVNVTVPEAPEFSSLIFRVVLSLTFKL